MARTDFEGRCPHRGGVPISAPPLKSHVPPLGEVSKIYQSENLTFFGCLAVRVNTFKKVFL